MKAIVAADRNWGIGYQNRLLVSIPSDMKFFRQTTTGHVVVMGRKKVSQMDFHLKIVRILCLLQIRIMQ